MLNINKNIKLIATDFDGVLTDGHVYYSSVSDEEIKKISFKDIMGISLAIKNNYKIAIISGEKNYIIDRLARKFNIEEVHQGIESSPVRLYHRSSSQRQVGPCEVRAQTNGFHCK